jgi:hypothetical protein
MMGERGPARERPQTQPGQLCEPHLALYVATTGSPAIERIAEVAVDVGPVNTRDQPLCECTAADLDGG